jgi:hypothetical protein
MRKIHLLAAAILVGAVSGVPEPPLWAAPTAFIDGTVTY